MEKLSIHCKANLQATWYGRSTLYTAYKDHDGNNGDSD